MLVNVNIAGILNCFPGNKRLPVSVNSYIILQSQENSLHNFLNSFASDIGRDWRMSRASYILPTNVWDCKPKSANKKKLITFDFLKIMYKSNWSISLTYVNGRSLSASLIIQKLSIEIPVKTHKETFIWWLNVSNEITFFSQ